MKHAPSFPAPRLAAVFIFALLPLFAVSSILAADKPDKKKKGKEEEPVPDKVLTAPVKPLAGPRRVVAVGKFDCIGSFRQNFGDWDIGGGMSAMLATALLECEQFVVVERAYLSQ